MTGWWYCIYNLTLSKSTILFGLLDRSIRLNFSPYHRPQSLMPWWWSYVWPKPRHTRNKGVLTLFDGTWIPATLITARSPPQPHRLEAVLLVYNLRHITVYWSEFCYGLVCKMTDGRGAVVRPATWQEVGRPPQGWGRPRSLAIPVASSLSLCASNYIGNLNVETIYSLVMRYFYTITRWRFTHGYVSVCVFVCMIY